MIEHMGVVGNNTNRFVLFSYYSKFKFSHNLLRTFQLSHLECKVLRVI